jgi:hypothetical protein
MACLIPKEKGSLRERKRKREKEREREYNQIFSSHLHRIDLQGPHSLYYLFKKILNLNIFSKDSEL